MKFLSSIAAAALCFTSTLALQSAPFFLVVDSTNSTLNGKTLEAGHEGAGIEGLLLSETLAKAKKHPQYNTYNFNYTHSDPNDGLLVWKLVGGNFVESEAMQFYVDPSTNVAIALFEPSYSYQYVSFDSKNQMFVKSYYNDLVSPPVDGKAQDLYHWNICEYNYSGYIYPVLCWTYGVAAPQNPSCQAVNVTRVFK